MKGSREWSERAIAVTRNSQVTWTHQYPGQQSGCLGKHDSRRERNYVNSRRLRMGCYWLIYYPSVNNESNPNDWQLQGSRKK